MNARNKVELVQVQSGDNFKRKSILLRVSGEFVYIPVSKKIANKLKNSGLPYEG